MGGLSDKLSRIFAPLEDLRASGLLGHPEMGTQLRAIVVLASSIALCGCKPASKRVDDALNSGGSWAATVKVVTEQWAQSRVSLRFVRTTLNTATNNLYRDAESIRSLDPAAAARLDRVKNAIEPVMAEVALNEPDRARDAAQAITSIIEPDPRLRSGYGEAGSARGR